MDFMTAVRTVLTEKYATFQGRASRPEYWWFILAVVIGFVITNLVWWLLGLLFYLAILCPGLAATWRRLQDSGRPGWYAVIPFALGIGLDVFGLSLPSEEAMAAGELPGMGFITALSVLVVINFIVFIIYLWWLTRPSQPDTNAYGPPPTHNA